jgi:hypothetical protein
MSQITHLATLPKNIDYWDYYILCRCDDAASKVLQRMEYWDGTKANGNVHNERDNDQAIEAGQIPTQDTSRFVYKTREELAWEMIGAVKERSAYTALDDIIKLKYLKSRHNPYKTFDRTLQYEFQYELVQEHLNKLYSIIQCFVAHGRQMRPVLYAIECLTDEGIFLNRIEQEDGTLDGKDLLSVVLVAERLELMHKQMHLDEEESKRKLAEGEKRRKPFLPTFIKSDLKKDEARGFSEAFPLCKNAQCIHAFLHNASGQKCTMHCAEKHNGLCKFAQAIPVITTVITNSDYKTESDNVKGVVSDETDTGTPTSSDSLSEQSQGPAIPKDEELPKQPTNENKLPRKRAPRKSKAKGFEVPAELVERVNKFYEFLNGWAVKKTGVKQTWFAPDDESNELICALLTSRTVTQKTLEQVCNALWDEPKNTRNGYWAREHMTVKAIINAYKAKSLMLAANESKAATTVIAQQYSVAGYTYKPEEAKTPDLPFAGPLRLRNKKRGA